MDSQIHGGREHTKNQTGCLAMAYIQESKLAHTVSVTDLPYFPEKCSNRKLMLVHLVLVHLVQGAIDTSFPLGVSRPGPGGPQPGEGDAQQLRQEGRVFCEHVQVN